MKRELSWGNSQPSLHFMCDLVLALKYYYVIRPLEKRHAINEIMDLCLVLSVR